MICLLSFEHYKSTINTRARSLDVGPGSLKTKINQIIDIVVIKEKESNGTDVTITQLEYKWNPSQGQSRLG